MAVRPLEVGPEVEGIGLAVLGDLPGAGDLRLLVAGPVVLEETAGPQVGNDQGRHRRGELGVERGAGDADADDRRAAALGRRLRLGTVRMTCAERQKTRR